MMGTPGSIGWLLRYEVKLAWYNLGSGKSKAMRRPGAGGLATIALAWLALHGVAFFIVARTQGIDTSDPRVLVAVTALLYGCMTFMLSTALSSSVLVLFERGDLDLLLSSPLSSRSIFTVRLGVVVAGTAALYLFLLTPFAHAGALLGHVGWLAVYPVLLGCATVIACAAMLLTLGLVRLLGARKTRVVAQVIGALAGALLFILAQAFNYFSGSREAEAAQAFAQAFSSSGVLGAASPLWLPGRALLGEPLPVAGLVLLAGAAFALTAGRTHRFFVHGLQQAASSSRAAARPSRPLRHRFGASLFDTIVRKEWRLIRRDPHLISQVALQLIYLLPIFFVVFGKHDVRYPAVSAGMTLLCASLTAALAWIIVSAEDAPDLLTMAPASTAMIRFAKLAAGAMPALAIAFLPLAWLVVREPLAGLLACFTVSGATCTAAVIVHWCGKPATRGELTTRGKSDTLTSVMEGANSLAWGGLAFCLSTIAGGSYTDTYLVGAAFSAMGTGVVLGMAWLMRRPRP
ncbi:hypothetical protein [uncultured Massilia sp.]|uniref:hypothetical protein n=1 Tax=uncultured Massilia sp. TaxID=169973 RepID=UPI00258FCBAA|nr:hypothetical protein [uncultured Massilia sp.]